ncbi:hypothetical protein [Pantanalinema sp. GBBB05]|uniref:hypothetical protein n=1 Tax=Pantanalinema sp. GBBB05 TaxID=2604139 RepID=UPI001D1FB7EC|nr:hypothetical protein [Pantanalinema sp. GBBB05]
MEIREQTSTKLVIYSKPVKIWLFVSLFVVAEFYMLLFGYEIPPNPTQRYQWIVIPFMVFTLFFFYSWLTIITLTLDKETGMLKLEKQLLTKTTLEKPLAEISRLELRQADTEGTPIHPVHLVLKSGEKLPAYSTLGWFSNWQIEQQQVATTITDFLNLQQ